MSSPQPGEPARNHSRARRLLARPIFWIGLAVVALLGTIYWYNHHGEAQRFGGPGGGRGGRFGPGANGPLPVVARPVRTAILTSTWTDWDPWRRSPP